MTPPYEVLKTETPRIFTSAGLLFYVLSSVRSEMMNRGRALVSM